MSIRTSFRQALRICHLQKTLGFPGSNALNKGQTGQPWLKSSTGYRHIISRPLSKATGKFHSGLLPEGQDPTKIFKTHLAEGTLTNPLAASCLKTAIRMERYDDGLGEAAIKWFWHEHDNYKFPDDTVLLDAMIRLLVHEAKEDLVWSWIEQKSRKRGNLGPTERFTWRADAVKSLITARAFASEDSLDAALEAFFRARSSSYSIPLAPARTECAKLLMRPATKMSQSQSQQSQDGVETKIEQPRWPNTSLELWDAFLESIDAKADVSEPFRVQLPLYRPDGPDPYPFLKYSRHLAGHPTLVQRMLKRQSLVPWIARGRHAEAVLRQKGHDEDANWLGRFTQELDSKSQVIRKRQGEKREARQERSYKKNDPRGELGDSPSQL